MTYDGITAQNIREGYGWDPYTTDRYLLPDQSQWLSVNALLEPLPIPDFHAMRVPAAIPRPDEDALREMIEATKRSFEETFSAEESRLKDIRSMYECEEPSAIATLIGIANKRHPFPRQTTRLIRRSSKSQILTEHRCNAISGVFQDGFSTFVDATSKLVLIELQFPDFTGHQFEVKVTGGGLDRKAKYAAETQKKKIVRQCLYSLVIRAGYIASVVLKPTSYKTVVINVSQDWFDQATGAPRTGIICSLQGQVDEFSALHLDKVDPESCFKHFKGIALPSFESISPIRPIFVLNKSDDRFIATKELDSFISPEANLAAMPWEDFEQLVAQLFEWEFAKEGVEVKVTRASRDRGVDAVLFDPDPLRGGKYVLQAKRYTKTVDVAAVRDLYGTVVNEGANRGILITTSSYGPDSYAFAKDKPISLVDGPNLLVMLQRHGKKFRIDLEEARRLYQEG